MSIAYDAYLAKHKNNVYRAFQWIQENAPELIAHDVSFGGVADYEWQIGHAHDQSKGSPEEYEAYDNYFYGNNRSYAVVNDFNRAWLQHIHNNPHHWQHWILINDEPGEGEIILEMPYNYILEMICDWWAFSFASGNLREIFSWYDAHKDYIKLHPTSRKNVEFILDTLKKRLDAVGEL